MCEECRPPAGTRLTFEAAFASMREGFRLRRPGWNGRDMWVRAAVPGERRGMREFLVLENAVGGVVPWMPSNGDLFANDWEVVK